MRLIVCGPRHIINPDIDAAMKEFDLHPGLIICGCASGVDRAGAMRNRQMLQSPADAVLALWDNESRGTGNMIEIAKAAEIPVYVHRLLEQEV